VVLLLALQFGFKVGVALREPLNVLLPALYFSKRVMKSVAEAFEKLPVARSSCRGESEVGD